MKKLLLLLIIPFLSFGQSIDRDFKNNDVGNELELIECDLEILVDYDYNGNGNWYPINQFEPYVEMLCFGDSIFINTTPAGGTPPYYVTCTSSLGVEIDLTTGFSTGDYVILVSDSEGCESSPFFFTIGPTPSELTNSVLEITPVCADGIGTIELTVTGGTGPYTIEDFMFFSTQTINVLAGDIITVTDANVCETIVEIICDDTSIKELDNPKTLIKTAGILGRETTNNKGFQLHIYDDGTVEKKYLIK